MLQKNYQESQFQLKMEKHTHTQEKIEQCHKPNHCYKYVYVNHL